MLVEKQLRLVNIFSESASQTILFSLSIDHETEYET